MEGDTYVMSPGVLATEAIMCNVTANLIFRILTKDMPEEQRKKWYELRRHNYLKSFLQIATPESGSTLELEYLESLRVEMNELKVKLKLED